MPKEIKRLTRTEVYEALLAYMRSGPVSFSIEDTVVGKRHKLRLTLANSMTVNGVREDYIPGQKMRDTLLRNTAWDVATNLFSKDY